MNSSAVAELSELEFSNCTTFTGIYTSEIFSVHLGGIVDEFIRLIESLKNFQFRPHPLQI